MESEEQVVAPRAPEVLMVESTVVRQIRELRGLGWGYKRIARELGVDRRTVRRYVRPGVIAGEQERPTARRMTPELRTVALRLFEGEAQGNGVVLWQMLRERGVQLHVRSVQRLVEGRRREIVAAQLATVRFETAPGQQMQIDFGQKRVVIAGAEVVVHFLVAVLSYSRRIFVKPFLSERGDDWREGIAEAFRHFGGVPRTVLGDNARALVVEHNRQAGTITFHPEYLSFCRDWDVAPRACGPYRARTKGKTEAGVKFVKRNALAGRAFESFASLEANLQGWMQEVDQRLHGTTHETPAKRFERDERATLRPLPLHPLSVRGRRLTRRVALDAMVDVDTVRYSVPHHLVREQVEVLVGERHVRIYHAQKLVTTHERGREPHARIVDRAHFKGLWRFQQAPTCQPPSTSLEALGRSLRDYAVVVGEVA
jgi:transposase